MKFTYLIISQLFTWDNINEFASITQRFNSFYQRKIEWVRLKERHPDKFEEAKAYEKQLSDEKSTNGETYYWMGKNTPLSTLEDPERVAQIKADHEQKLVKFKKKRRRNVLHDDQLIEMIDLDAVYDDMEGGGACVTCYK